MSGSEGKASVLLVDDRPEKVLAIEAVLEDLDVNIVRAYSGREALRHVLGQDFAVILLDVNMPGIDGFETLAQIRQIVPSVAVVMMTATEDEAMAGRARASGAVAFMKKPFYPADIDAVIVRIYSGQA